MSVAAERFRRARMGILAAALRRVLGRLRRRRHPFVTSSGVLGTLRGLEYPRGLGPEVGAAPDEVRARLDDLARDGRLDEGNAGLLDPEIMGSWVPRWQSAVDEWHNSNQIALQDYEGEAAARVQRAMAELQRLDNELADLRAWLDAVYRHRPDLLLFGEQARPRRGPRPQWFTRSGRVRSWP
jgi:hypothetical protein